MTQYSIEQVQTQLNDILQAFEHGEAIEITRKGQQVATLIIRRGVQTSKKRKIRLW